MVQMVKNLPAMLETPGLITGSGRYPGEGNGNPLQYSCLENPLDGGDYSPWGGSEWDMTSLSLWGRLVPIIRIFFPCYILKFYRIGRYYFLILVAPMSFCLDFSGCGYFLCFLLFFTLVHVISYTYTSSPYEHIYYLGVS